MDIKNLDIETIRKYVIWAIIISIIIGFRDIFIGLIVTILSVFGITVVGELPPGFMFMIIAVGFFGFALFFVMILQKKKLQRPMQRQADLIPRGFCDICNNPKAKNVLPMQYKEEGKDDATIYVCEVCRNEVKEIREDDKKKESKNS